MNNELGIYLNDWEDSKMDGVIKDFEIKAKALDGVEVLLASYTYEDYSGDAFVLFRKDGELYEVNGGHCSCNGLEGQWAPEKTDVKSLKHRIENGTLGREDCFSKELSQVLESLNAR